MSELLERDYKCKENGQQSTEITPGQSKSINMGVKSGGGEGRGGGVSKGIWGKKKITNTGFAFCFL
jgi:hypothetical protein